MILNNDWISEIYHHNKNRHIYFDILCKVQFVSLMFSTYLVKFMTLWLLLSDCENIRDCEFKYNITG